MPTPSKIDIPSGGASLVPGLPEGTRPGPDSAPRLIVWLTLALGVTATTVAAAAFGTPGVVLGVLAGFVIALANFIFLTKILVKLLNSDYTRRASLAGLFLGKLIFMAAIAVGVIWLEISGIAFMAGYLNLIVAILIHRVFITKDADTAYHR